MHGHNCTRRHGKCAPGTTRRANLARQPAPETRFDETDLDNGHDGFERDWAAHDYKHEDSHGQHQVSHARARHTAPSVERYNYLAGSVDYTSNQDTYPEVTESQRHFAEYQGLSSASMANTVLHSSRDEQVIKGFALFHDILASEVLISEVASTERSGVNGFASFYAYCQVAGVKASESDTSSLHQLKTVQAGAKHAYAFFHDVAPSTASVTTVQKNSAGVQG